MGAHPINHLDRSVIVCAGPCTLASALLLVETMGLSGGRDESRPDGVYLRTYYYMYGRHWGRHVGCHHRTQVDKRPPASDGLLCCKAIKLFPLDHRWPPSRDRVGE